MRTWIPAALGIGLEAFVVIRLGQHSRNTVEHLQAHLEQQPEVLASWYVGGIDDFLVHVAVRDTKHLQDLLMDRITTRREVARVRTEIVFRQYRRNVLPAYVG
jgi:DNA-binding Lrp family transcriptional regulator